MSIRLSKLIPAAALVGFFGISQATVNYPFPQNSNYNGNGITLSDKDAAASQLKAAFKYYLENMYNENGGLGGIRSNPGSSEYFSEGVGYGMLMMVYFSDNTTSYQPQFDKLWALYKAFPDSLGLMNWKIGNLDPSKSSNIWGKGAATDAEMDVAAALILAARQFGEESYLSEAASLLEKVRLYEFEKNGLHKPGDSWNDKKNPSYVAPAYYELFKEVDTDGASFWATALDVNYALLQTNSDQYSTGLFDNWSNSSGTGLDNYYGYDAARTPWRLAQAYYWWGHDRAQTMLDKLGGWVAGKSASSVKGSIQRSGSMGADHNSTFVATLMASLVTSSARQAKLDEFWNEAVSLGEENYFNESMKILCGLAVSGNMPLFDAGLSPVKPGQSGTGASFSWTRNQIVLDNLAASPLEVKLLALDGKVLRTLHKGPVSGSLTLSLAGLEPGLRLVQVSQGSLVTTHKIVIR